MARPELELRLDYDSPGRGRQSPLVPYPKIVARLMRAGFEIQEYNRRRSPSGHGWHVIIRLTPAPRDPMEVIALQAICGSDPLREASNVRRVRSLPGLSDWWADKWNVLYGRIKGGRDIGPK